MTTNHAYTELNTEIYIDTAHVRHSHYSTACMIERAVRPNTLTSTSSRRAVCLLLAPDCRFIDGLVACLCSCSSQHDRIRRARR